MNLLFKWRQLFSPAVEFIRRSVPTCDTCAEMLTTCGKPFTNQTSAFDVKFFKPKMDSTNNVIMEHHAVEYDGRFLKHSINGQERCVMVNVTHDQAAEFVNGFGDVILDM